MTDIDTAAPATEMVSEPTVPATGGKSEIASQLKGNLEGGKTDRPRESNARQKLREQIDKSLYAATTKLEEKPTGERARGPDGKFVAQPDAPVESVDGAAAEPIAEAPAVPDVGAAPSSWKKDAQAKWGELPDWARAEIAKREQDVEKGFAKYQALRNVEPVLDWIGQQAPQHGTTVQQVVQNWAQTQAALLNPQSAPQAIQALAQQYLPPQTLRALAQQVLGNPQGQQQGQIAQQPAQAAEPVWVDPELAELKRQLAEQQTWRQTIEQQAQQAAQDSQRQAYRQKVSAIDIFGSEKGQDGQLLRPHLETVMPDMVASIAQIRTANPQLSDQDVLQQAYDRAVWSNPDTRKQVLDAQKLAEENERKAKARERAQAATRQAVSPPSASPQGQPTRQVPKGSLRDQMRSTFENLTA